jgi:hypothetical protein
VSKDANREAMPLSAAWLDKMTAVFGKPTAGWFLENGQLKGWGKPATTPDQLPQSGPFSLPPALKKMLAQRQA